MRNSRSGIVLALLLCGSCGTAASVEAQSQALTDSNCAPRTDLSKITSVTAFLKLDREHSRDRASTCDGPDPWNYKITLNVCAPFTPNSWTPQRYEIVTVDKRVGGLTAHYEYSETADWSVTSLATYAQRTATGEYCATWTGTNRLSCAGPAHSQSRCYNIRP
jgi:hypothetical protein